MNEYIENAIEKFRDTKVKDLDPSLVVALKQKSLIRFSDGYIKELNRK